MYIYIYIYININKYTYIYTYIHIRPLKRKPRPFSQPRPSFPWAPQVGPLPQGEGPAQGACRAGGDGATCHRRVHGGLRGRDHQQAGQRERLCGRRRGASRGEDLFLFLFSLMSYNSHHNSRAQSEKDCRRRGASSGQKTRRGIEDEDPAAYFESYKLMTPRRIVGGGLS